ncbi:hypothetical protein VTO42DRAFT_5763 [Malbranchea cinnamomea]
MSYPAIAPSTIAPTPPPSMSASDESPRLSPKDTKKSRKSSNKTPSKLGSGAGVCRKSEKQHRRSRSGCFTCRLRRKKCDEGKPICKACRKLKLKCEYSRPMWWGNNEQRQSQKERIKELIKSTKLDEKTAAAAARAQRRIFTPPSLAHSAPTPDPFGGEGIPNTREASTEPKCAVEGDFNHLYGQDSYDPLKSQLQTPHFDSFWTAGVPYEVDIKTEREVFVNDVPMRKDSTVSTFSTYQPSLVHATLPAFTGDDWLNGDYFDSHSEHVVVTEIHELSPFEFSHPPVHIVSVDVDDCDRYLLDHFFDKVMRLMFPVLEARLPGTVRSDVVLPAIESNKSYLHCCLTSAAAHLKTTQKSAGDQFDNEILRHRYQTVSELCKALNQDTDHDKILEATLALICFQCAVGRPDDSLPDIPWHQHFQAATSLIHKLDLPNRLLDLDKSPTQLPPFNMALAAWIDILGSTMLGQMPQFAHTYRAKLFNGSGIGLCELMGCEDRVMYLIAEIACLDVLKAEGRVDHLALCGHITTLAQQLDHIEPSAGSLVDARAEPGIVDPHQLTKNITALFCVAARLYLCSLVPGFHRSQPSSVKLVNHAAELLELIPGGPEGFDRALVWPLTICGAHSAPDSPLRRTLHKRTELLGEEGTIGNFGRMMHLLQETWLMSDDLNAMIADNHKLKPKEREGQSMQTSEVSTTTTATHDTQSVLAGGDDGQPVMEQCVHWRDVMKRNGWEYLLI